MPVETRAQKRRRLLVESETPVPCTPAAPAPSIPPPEYVYPPLSSTWPPGSLVRWSDQMGFVFVERGRSLVWPVPWCDNREEEAAQHPWTQDHGTKHDWEFVSAVLARQMPKWLPRRPPSTPLTGHHADTIAALGLHHDSKGQQRRFRRPGSKQWTPLYLYLHPDRVAGIFGRVGGTPAREWAERHFARVFHDSRLGTY